MYRINSCRWVVSWWTKHIIISSTPFSYNPTALISGPYGCKWKKTRETRHDLTRETGLWSVVVSLARAQSALSIESMWAALFFSVLVGWSPVSSIPQFAFLSYSCSSPRWSLAVDHNIPLMNEVMRYKISYPTRPHSPLSSEQSKHQFHH